MATVPEVASSALDPNAPIPPAVLFRARRTLKTRAARGVSTVTAAIDGPLMIVDRGRPTGATIAVPDVTPARAGRLARVVLAIVPTVPVPMPPSVGTTGLADPVTTTVPVAARSPAKVVTVVLRRRVTNAIRTAVPEVIGPTRVAPTPAPTDASTGHRARAATTVAAPGTGATARSVPGKTGRSDGTTAPGAVIVPVARTTGPIDRAEIAALTVKGPTVPAMAAMNARPGLRTPTDLARIAVATVVAVSSDRAATAPGATARPRATSVPIAGRGPGTGRAALVRIGPGAVRPTGARPRTVAPPAGLAVTVTGPGPSQLGTTAPAATATVAAGRATTDHTATAIAAAPTVRGATAIAAATDARRSTATRPAPADPTKRHAVPTAEATSTVAPGPSVRRRPPTVGTRPPRRPTFRGPNVHPV